MFTITGLLSITILIPDIINNYENHLYHITNIRLPSLHSISMCMLHRELLQTVSLLDLRRKT